MRIPTDKLWIKLSTKDIDLNNHRSVPKKCMLHNCMYKYNYIFYVLLLPLTWYILVWFGFVVCLFCSVLSGLFDCLLKKLLLSGIQIYITCNHFFLLQRYDIMVRCWKINATERPSFADLAEIFAEKLKENLMAGN